MPAQDPTRSGSAAPEEHEEDAMIDADEIGEEVDDMDEDAPMDEDDDEPLVEGGGVEEVSEEFQNDSIAHFDGHADSVFAIASHPKQPLLVVTGSGDDTAFVWSADPQPDLLPKSFGAASASGSASARTGASEKQEPGRASLASVAQLKGHEDTVIATAFTGPSGDYLLTAGMDGRVRVYNSGRGGVAPRDASGYTLAVEAREVEEVTWLSTCPSPDRPNVFAFGGSDGSVWVYEIVGGEGGGKAELQLLQAYYQHTMPCTAGAWSASGALLATVSEESSLYVFDPFGLAAGGSSGGTAAVVALTADDARFAVEGGLYSVAVTPGGTLVAVGGHGGSIRVVGLPRTTTDPASSSAKPQKGSSGSRAAQSQQSGGQAGQIVASLSTGGDSVETLAFSPTGALLAAGDVDGNIRLFDTARNFALRKHFPEAHENQAVVSLRWLGAGAKPGSPEATRAANQPVLYSAGMDGVLRKWDAKAGALVKEAKGHRGGGEGGGIMAFVLVQDDEGRNLIVTAGDDGVSLVFNAD